MAKNDRVRVVTLTTDFGTRDYFVGAMKGVIAEINPHAHIIDITHDLPPYDFVSAAFTIASAYSYFPRWTVHVVVVDPTVGSSRRPILVVGDQHYFVGPDNGVFSLIYEREPYIRVYHLTEEHFFRPTITATFHGRDIFAPVAAWLTRDVEPAHMGEVIEDFTKVTFPKPAAQGENRFQGIVLHIDRFGNLITNFSYAFLKEVLGESLETPCRVRIQNQVVPGVKRAYFEVNKGHPVAVLGSSGYLEISINQGNAAHTFQAKRGTQVQLEIG